MIKRKQFFKFLSPYCIAFEKSVGAVVFRVVANEIEFLVIKYRNGHWEFPRGKTEDGETEQETAAREIAEETGLSSLKIIKGFRQTMSFSYKAHGHEFIERKKDKGCIYVHKKAVFYLAEVINPDVVISHEHQKFKWLSFDKALDILTFSNAKNVLIEASCELGSIYENKK